MACHDQSYAIPCRRYKVLTPTTTIGTVSREFGGPYIEQTDGGLGDADKLACLRPPASTLNTVLVCAGSDRQSNFVSGPRTKKEPQAQLLRLFPDSAVTSAGTANLIMVGSTDLVRPDPPRERRVGTT